MVIELLIVFVAFDGALCNVRERSKCELRLTLMSLGKAGNCGLLAGGLVRSDDADSHILQRCKGVGESHNALPLTLSDERSVRRVPTSSELRGRR